MLQFFVVKPDGTRLGPFDEATIDQMHADGQIGPDDTVEQSVVPNPEAPSEPTGGSFLAPPQPVKGMSPVFWVLIAVLVLCIPCIGIVASIMFPVFAQAKLAAKMTSTMSDLKQVGSAMASYQVDNDDMFPPRMDTLSDAWPSLGRYAKRDMPESNNPGHPEFSGNSNLAGTLATKVDAPQRTYLFFDSAPWTTEKRVVGFVDSSAKIMKEPAFQEGVLHGMVEQ